MGCSYLYNVFLPIINEALSLLLILPVFSSQECRTAKLRRKELYGSGRRLSYRHQFASLLNGSSCDRPGRTHDAVTGFLHLQFLIPFATPPDTLAGLLQKGKMVMANPLILCH